MISTDNLLKYLVFLTNLVLLFLISISIYHLLEKSGSQDKAWIIGSVLSIAYFIFLRFADDILIARTNLKA